MAVVASRPAARTNFMVAIMSEMVLGTHLCEIFLLHRDLLREELLMRVEDKG